jgi:hypothetical protein
VTDPHVLGPDLTPTPFTAGEIRQGCPPGRLIRLRIDTADGPSYERTNRFVDCDDEGATIERRVFGADGSPIGAPETGRTTWAAFQLHAAFPLARTTVEPDVIESPMGRLECLRFTVLDGADTDIFWFAMSKPGMPVRVVTERDGRLVESMTMIADEHPDESP